MEFDVREPRGLDPRAGARERLRLTLERDDPRTGTVAREALGLLARAATHLEHDTSRRKARIAMHESLHRRRLCVKPLGLVGAVAVDVGTRLPVRHQKTRLVGYEEDVLNDIAQIGRASCRERV